MCSWPTSRSSSRRSATSPLRRLGGTRPITARRRRVALSRRGDAARPRVAVIGAGSWGTTFGKILADGGADVTMWARRPELAGEIHEAKRNSEYLPGINLPRSMDATHHLSEALEGAEQVYLSIPSQAVRQNLKAVRPLVERTDVPIVSLMKGVERRTGLRMSQVIEQELDCDPARIAVASGPNLALEIAREQPTAAVISSTSQETAEAVARRARNRYFRTFVNTAGRLLGQGYRFDDVVKQMNQTAEGLASVAPILQLAREVGVEMPIVEQVKMVLDGTMNPRDIAPHLTTDDDTPKGERTQNGQAGGGGALWRALQRALDQFRNGGGGPPPRPSCGGPRGSPRGRPRGGRS